MGDPKTRARRWPNWTTWLIVAIVVMLTIAAFVLLVSIYLPLS